MTAYVSLSDGTHTVNFNDAATASDVNISHRFSNPILTFDTPIDLTQTIGENTIPINLGFVVNAFDMTFTLSDGPGTFDFKTPVTAYEKIMHMANYVKNVKTLTLNGTAFNGQIENVNVTWESGKKDVAQNCTLSFHLTKDLKMDVTKPAITTLAPSTGAAAGGTSVTITGTAFTGATSVTFGGTAAAFTVDSATQITATSPAHAAGVVDVIVTTSAGASATGATSKFTYT